MGSKSEPLGKVALVTGSSTGIGAAIARQLAENGSKVILHGRILSPELAQTSQQLTQSGHDVKSLSCDFTDAQAVETFATSAWELFGTIDVLVNNAGGDVLTAEQADFTPTQKLDFLYSIDCRATFQLSRIIGARMKELRSAEGHRSIVNIGWDQAFQGMEGDSGEVFSAIKGSVMSMTLSLAQSLAPDVRVNCVAPGWIKTQWGEQASEYWNNRARSESLMARWGTAEDIANAVSFLASEKASFVSGQILNVNGGFRFGQAGDRSH